MKWLWNGAEVLVVTGISHRIFIFFLKCKSDPSSPVFLSLDQYSRKLKKQQILHVYVIIDQKQDGVSYILLKLAKKIYIFFQYSVS